MSGAVEAADIAMEDTKEKSHIKFAGIVLHALRMTALLLLRSAFGQRRSAGYGTSEGVQRPGFRRSRMVCPGWVVVQWP